MRLTRRVFDDLAIWMTAFGLVVGLAFPFAAVGMGLPPDRVLQPDFMALCLVAGATVGLANIALARAVVLPRLRGLAAAMSRVEQGVVQATLSGDWSRCDPESCSIPVDSDDAIGTAARAYNGLVGALARSHAVAERTERFADAMARQLELDPLGSAALDGMLQDGRADAVAILVERGGELEVLASHGVARAAELAGHERVLRTLSTGRAEELEIPEGVLLSGGVVDFRPREVRLLPLLAHGVTLGVVLLAYSHPAGPEQRTLARSFARSLSMALTNALTHTQLQRIAALDPLTACYNRRFGEARLQEEFSRAVRADAPLAVVMFDIDHFKSINDTYGHLGGDRVLVAVSRAARQRLREGDVLVRYGGEEFLAILPGASVEDARGLCERIRRAIEELVVPCGDQQVRCTVSLGYAALDGASDLDERGLVGRADEALYRAKRSGRNRALHAA